MERTSFWRLHALIEDYEGFSKRDGHGRKQIASQYQLLVLLAFLRTEGDGMSNQHGRTNFYVAYGSISHYKERAAKAILRNLFDRYVHWPSAAERVEIAKRFYYDYGIPNLVGVADGTLFPLAFKPRRDDYQDFHGRKFLYSLSTLIVNDDRRRVRYFLAGWAGTAHDERVFTNSMLCRHHEEYFDHNQFILGDSAYSPRDFVIPAFKKPNGGDMPRDYENFNTTIAKPRVSSEHTIGMLKGRFPFLRSIRMQLGEGQTDMRKIVRMISVCVTLHNVLIDFKDEIDLYPDDISEIDADDELNRPVPDEFSSTTRRYQLMNYILETYY